MAVNWTLIGYVIGGAATVAAALIVWFSRRPSDALERSEQIVNGAWRLKDAAEERLRIVEEKVKDNAAVLAGLEAEKVAQRTLHQAELKAQQTLHEADMLAKDRIIVRLTERIDTLERQLDTMFAERRGTADALPLQIKSTVSRGDATSD